MSYSQATIRYRKRQRRKVASCVETFTDLAAAHDNGVLEAFTLTASAQEVYPGNAKLVKTTFNPPRNLVIDATAGGGTPVAGDVIVYGKDVYGNAISETFALNNETAVVGTQAFAEITRVHLPTRTQASDAVFIGFGLLVGLEECLKEDSIVSVSCDGAVEVHPTVTFDSDEPSKNTVSFNTAPNGTHDFAVYYLLRE